MVGRARIELPSKENLLTLLVESETQTARIAATLATRCQKGDCLLLAGELGTGKTVFARGFVQSICGEAEEVLSPTFTLMQSYPTSAGWPVCHFDLYRLKNAMELDQLGLDEALTQGVALIEWPEIAADRLPFQALTVHLAAEGECKRRVSFLGHVSVWQSRLRHIA